MSDPRCLTRCGTEKLMKEVKCPRCNLTDWQKFEEQLDIRCGGCGLWWVSWLLASIREEPDIIRESQDD